jgi:protein-glutamine gamma-glutamyltransferase
LRALENLAELPGVYVERLLQINMAALACLATLLLGMGERSTAMPLGMLIAAMVSVWITDIKGWFRLSKRVADWAALAALAVCLPGALRLERIAIIEAVADFVVLLQVIHLFQKKDAAVCWQLMRFSVLQVVVAALLTQEILFGALLIVYLFTALGAMSLLFVYSEWGRHGSRESTEPAAAVGQGRWPLTHQEATFWSGPTGRAPLGREFFTRLFKIGVATLVVGTVVFIAVPRMGRGAWRGFGGMARSTVGFSGRMRLGELGKIIQDPAEVMRVRFSRSDTGEPYKVSDGIYLRGAVLTEYDRGEWRPPFGTADFENFHSVLADQPIRVAPVRQEIHLEPLDRDELFCVWPFTFLHPDNRMAYIDWAQRLARLPDFRRYRFAYELGTTAFWNNEQVPLVPNDRPVDPAPYLQMPGENGRATLPGLVALAELWTAESRVPAADRYNRALVLERRLRSSGRFTYSLEGQSRDRSLDPVEDFITKNPRGHCEYFATALCLMLRSQRIPARVVIGYHTNEFNDLGQFFLVRQLHAHTWVEAYLPPSRIPNEAVRERPSWQWLSGGWLRLDATPSSEETSPAISLLARIGGLFDRINFAWTNYVMEMDRPRQREAIYHPIADAVRKAFRTVTDPDWWRSLAARTAEALGLGRWWTSGRPWFSWQALGLVLLIGLVGLGGYRVALVFYARWIVPRLSSQARAARGRRTRVEFYRRFEAILARRGLVRRSSQTQREFALAAAAKIGERVGDGQLAPPALDVVQAFYLVRFGGATLDEPQAEAVEHALVKVEQLVKP